MNDIDKIKAKIKKLLALSKSPYPNEAANALKMAQELMDKYEVEQTDINNIEIDEDITSTIVRRAPPKYECVLFAKISDAFGCKLIHHCRYSSCVWRFIGLQHRAQVAAYIGQVLIRKLKSARTQYIKSLYRVRSKYRKTQRADDFCFAWVCTVTDKLSSFAGVNEAEQKAIANYVNKNHPDLGNLNFTNRSFGNGDDYLNGCRAGERVHLQHGVGVDPRSSLLLRS